jgi:hypothetical protein
MKRTLLSLLALVTLCAVLWAMQVNGYLDFFQVTAPGNPPSGQTRVYVDGTQKILYDKTDGGLLHHMVATSSCSGGTPVVGNINIDGTVTCVASGSAGNTTTFATCGTFPPSTAGHSNGDVYLCSDSFYSFVLTSGAWQTLLYGVPVTGASVFLNGGTLIAQTTGSQAASPGGVITLDASGASAATKIVAYVVPIPVAATYKIWSDFTFTPNQADDGDFGGLVWTDGTANTSNAVIFGVRTTGKVIAYFVANMSSPTFTAIFDPGSQMAGASYGTPSFRLGIEQSSTNRNFVIPDDMFNTIQIATETNATHSFTPTHVGIFVRNNNNTTVPCRTTALSFKQQ